MTLDTENPLLTAQEQALARKLAAKVAGAKASTAETCTQLYSRLLGKPVGTERS